MRANSRAPPPDAFATSPRAFAGYGSRRARAVDARARRRRRRARSTNARATVSRARVASRARRASTPRARPFARARRIGRRTSGATSRAPCFAPVTSKSPRPRRARTRSPRAASPRERSGVYERGACLLPFTTYNPFYTPFKEIQPIYSTRGKNHHLPHARATLVACETPRRAVGRRAVASPSPSRRRASPSRRRASTDRARDARDLDVDVDLDRARPRASRPRARVAAASPRARNLEIARAIARRTTRRPRSLEGASLRMGLYPKL